MDIIEKIEKNKSSTLMLSGSDLDNLLSIMRKLRHMRERKAIKRLTENTLRKTNISKGILLG